MGSTSLFLLNQNEWVVEEVAKKWVRLWVFMAGGLVRDVTEALDKGLRRLNFVGGMA